MTFLQAGADLEARCDMKFCTGAYSAYRLLGVPISGRDMEAVKDKLRTIEFCALGTIRHLSDDTDYDISALVSPTLLARSNPGKVLERLRRKHLSGPCAVRDRPYEPDADQIYLSPYDGKEDPFI